ncbi:MAG TPA: tRNA epoxyqueuosine(34) reductase QueG [Thermodesulfobacteriota bacterium]
MDTVSLTKSIKDKALEIGFDLVGISPVDSFPENQFYKEWLARGFAGEMKYMERDPEKRENIKNILPDARSVISCGMNYNTDYPYSIDQTDKNRGWISRYAWGDDYHDVMNERLLLLEGHVREIAPKDIKSRLYVDTGPVLERVYGKYSGIGWYGKNTCLINQDIGSWIFLGEIITDFELDYDSPVPDRCGTCTMCLDVCPTNALRNPYVLDSNLCISYLTIEFRGKIPFDLREKMDNNIYGCDICQDVCPWNRKAKVSESESFQPRNPLYNPDLVYLSQLSIEEFRRVFKNSPVKRAKRKGFLRNVMVAMGNSGSEAFIPYIEEALKDDEPLIRAHAVWALWKLEGNESYDTLSKHLNVETDNSVREEIESILEKIGS